MSVPGCWRARLRPARKFEPNRPQPTGRARLHDGPAPCTSGFMIIATWNINGIKARLEVLTAWLKEANPDVVCLQEIKSIDENFPSAAIEELGYNVATHGQKGFNGVAILSKRPFDELIPAAPRRRQRRAGPLFGSGYLR